MLNDDTVVFYFKLNLCQQLFKLYDEETPLDLPDLSRPDCVKQLAASSIFIIMENKFLRDNASLKVSQQWNSFCHA